MVLDIDTSQKSVVVVSLKKDGVVLETLEGEHQYGSQVLLPLINQLLEKHNLEFKELTEIEVNVGPGSFTGLRVGAAVAQALGYSLNIPVNGKLNTPVDLRYT